MSELEDIEQVALYFKRNCPFEPMHAVSTYPMSDEDANLSV